MAVPEACCIECASADIRNDPIRGERYCHDCGRILEDDSFDDSPTRLTKQEKRPISPYKDGKGIPLKGPGRRLKWMDKREDVREHYSKTTDLQRQVESRVKQKIQHDNVGHFKEFSKLLKDVLGAKAKYLRSTPEKDHLFAPPGRADNVLSVAVATEVLRRRLRGEHATPKAIANILFPDDPDIDYGRLRKFATRDLKGMIRIASIRTRLKEQKQRRASYTTVPAKIEIFRRELSTLLIAVRQEFTEFPHQIPLDALLDSGSVGPEVVGILNDNVPEHTDSMHSLVLEVIYQSQSLEKKKIPRRKMAELAGYPKLRTEGKMEDAKRLIDYFNGV